MNVSEKNKIRPNHKVAGKKIAIELKNGGVSPYVLPIICRQQRKEKIKRRRHRRIMLIVIAKRELSLIYSL